MKNLSFCGLHGALEVAALRPRRGEVMRFAAVALGELPDQDVGSLECRERALRWTNG